MMMQKVIPEGEKWETGCWGLGNWVPSAELTDSDKPDMKITTDLGCYFCSCLYLFYCCNYFPLYCIELHIGEIKHD